MTGASTTKTVVTEAEFKDRQRRAVTAAAERGLDGLIVWARGGTSVDFYGDVLYLTNHHSPFPPNQNTPMWSARSYSGLLLPVDGEPALVVDLPEFDPGVLYVDDIRSALHIPQTFAEVLAERGLDRGRLGLIGRDTLLVSSLRLMEDTLGHALDLTPVDDIIDRMRMVKSEAELELIRRAAAVGIGWMNEMMDAVSPGRTEGEIVGRGLEYLSAHGGFAYDAAIASGPRSQYFFSRLGIPTWDSTRPLENGDLVHIDAWAAVDGYYTDFVRSTVVGRRPTSEQAELLEGSVALIDDLVDATRPGVTIGEIYQRGADWMREHGFGEHRGELADSGTDFGNLFPAFGHSFGAGLEPPWIIEHEPTVIEANMTLALETLLGRPGVGGAGFEHNVVVHADGCEVLTEACAARWWD
jgi:Xaa-Pro aminopeptidase